jgi:hypothetical protein
VRRSIGAGVVIVVGLVLLADAIVANPALDDIAGLLTEYLVLLAAAAAIAGVVALFVRHGGDLLLRRGDRIGSAVLLIGLVSVLVVGLRPDGAGAADPGLRWVVAALIVPLGASLGGLLFIFLLRGAGRGMRVNPREATLLLTVAAAAVVVLLPIGGGVGAALGGVSRWMLEGPVAAVFRGLLIGVAIAASVTAARFLFGVEHRDE